MESGCGAIGSCPAKELWSTLEHDFKLQEQKRSTKSHERSGWFVVEDLSRTQTRMTRITEIKVFKVERGRGAKAPCPLPNLQIVPSCGAGARDLILTSCAAGSTETHSHNLFRIASSRSSPLLRVDVQRQRRWLKQSVTI